MAEQSSPEYPFGDLLALARQSWIGAMAAGLAELGYGEYRRTDAAATRLLLRGPVPLGRLGATLGVTRQAARKVADGLQQRGLASTGRDRHDSRQVNVALTDAGRDYARAVVTVIARLNSEVARRADPNGLAAADAVLRLALFDDGARRRADALPRPGSRPRRPPSDHPGQRGQPPAGGGSGTRSPAPASGC